MSDQEFGMALESHRQKLHRYANKLFKVQRDDIENLVQDAMLKAWLNRGSYVGPTMSTWLFTIIQRLGYDKTRYASHRPIECQPSAPDWWEGEASLEMFPCNDRAFEDFIMGKAVASDLLEALPVKVREIMVLDSHEESYGEIAARMGIPEGTVKSRINRARTVAKTAYEGMGIF